MPTRFAAAIAIAVFLVASTALLALNRGGERLPLPARAAAQAALRDGTLARELGRHGYDHYRVTRLDSTSDRVAFFDGSRIRAVAAVDRAGRVENVQLFDPGAPRYGSRTSDSPWVLGLLALCFLLATLTLPLLSLRTLDVLALLAFGLPIVAGDHQLFALSVLSGYPPLAYLCGRCVWRAARGAGRPARPSTPLYDHLTARLPRQQSARFLTYAIAAMVLLLGAIAVGSPGAIDVGYASSAGATLLLHGTLPYGHMPTDVVHGDTYPLLNYIAYIPAAAVSPVRDAFDDTSGAVLVALAAALLVAATLRRSGPRMVLAWLCFPPVAIAVAAGTNDLLLAAAVAGAPHRSRAARAAPAWRWRRAPGSSWRPSRCFPSGSPAPAAARCCARRRPSAASARCWAPGCSSWVARARRRRWPTPSAFSSAAARSSRRGTCSAPTRWVMCSRPPPWRAWSGRR